MKSKTVCLLGLGKLSTAHYFQELELIRFDNQNIELFKLKVLQTDFREINLLLPKPSQQLDHLILRYLNELNELKFNSLIIPNITLHQTIDRVLTDFKTNYQIIHPVTETIKALKNKNVNQVFVFGSLYTMQSDYLKSNFSSANIEVLQPSHGDMLILDNIRIDVFNKTHTIDDVKSKYNTLVEKYIKKNNVIIACSELSLLLDKIYENVFDMADIQISAFDY
jgi:aspartate racemase